MEADPSTSSGDGLLWLRFYRTSIMKTISLTELRRNTTRLVRSVKNEKEIIITCYGKTIAIMTPIATENPRGKATEQKP
jgi:prevent-host-death family protein